MKNHEAHEKVWSPRKGNTDETHTYSETKH